MAPDRRKPGRDFLLKAGLRFLDPLSIAAKCGLEATTRFDTFEDCLGDPTQGLTLAWLGGPVNLRIELGQLASEFRHVLREERFYHRFHLYPFR